MDSFTSNVRSLEATFHSSIIPAVELNVKFDFQMPQRAAAFTAVAQGEDVDALRTVHGATESAYFGSLRRCQSGFGNVGIASAAVAPVAAVLAALAVFAAAAAGCIPQCFAVGH